MADKNTDKNAGKRFVATADTTTVAKNKNKTAVDRFNKSMGKKK